MNKRKSLIVFLICLSLFSCNRNTGGVDFQPDYHVLKDTPTIRNPLKDVNVLLSKLDLESIENGFDSIQIRFWCIYSNYEANCDLVTIKNTNSKWQAIHYTFNIGNIEKKSKISLTKEKKTPVSWSNLLNSLYSYGVKTLPDCTSIKEYDCPIMDPSFIIVEYSDKKLYRIYSYCAPMHVSDAIKENKQIKKIIQTVSSELDIPNISKMLLGI